MMQIPVLPPLMMVRPINHAESNIRMLMAAIIRRAAFDIALYKNDRKLVNRKLAHSAYNWMFNEPFVRPDPFDKMTSFLNICEILDQDPEWIRSRTLQLERGDVKKFDMAGSR
jgi:hypothetical protein